MSHRKKQSHSSHNKRSPSSNEGNRADSWLKVVPIMEKRLYSDRCIANEALSYLKADRRMSAAEVAELINNRSPAEIIEQMWSDPVAMAKSQSTPENLIRLWGRNKFNRIYPHLKGKRLRKTTKAKEANEGEGNECNERDERTNIAMNAVSRQAVKAKMAAAPKAMKATKRTNAMKAMKDMKDAPPKVVKAMKAMKAAAPKAMKAMTHTNAMMAIRVATARRFTRKPKALVR
jgi:hypothetical protein